jgi:hypothetical protein
MGDRVLAVGSRVECRHGGQKQFHPGVVSAMSADGATLSVGYDDGDKETDVPRFRAKLPGQKQVKQLPDGARVDAPFQNSKQLFGAKVVKVRRNNGERERDGARQQAASARARGTCGVRHATNMALRVRGGERRGRARERRRRRNARATARPNRSRFWRDDCVRGRIVVRSRARAHP